MTRVQTEEEFGGLLRADRAVFFLWVPWAIQARQAEKLVEAWARDREPPLEVFRVDPDDQPYVARWLAEQNMEPLGFTGSGAVAWVRAGRIVADLLSPLGGGGGELERLTRQAFHGDPGPSAFGTPRHSGG